MSCGEILLGTSGWSYKEWIGPFYSKMDKSMLRAYVKVFKTVEIDSTFYRYPSKGAVMGWARYSPDGFVYTAKLPRLITHEKKLEAGKGVEKDLEAFTELMEPLALSGKLGCILIQLPPRFDYRPEQLEDFFKLLPTHIKFAVEFRDPSWMRDETWTLLRKYKVAYTIVDEPLLPPEMHLTSEFTYFRWHGKGTAPWYNYHYPIEELQPWAPKVQEAAEKVDRVYGYFNNHYHGYAVENCLQIIEMIEPLEPMQVKAKTKAESYRKGAVQQTPSTLEMFVPPKDTSFQSLINYFVPTERLRRAEQIQDAEVAITKETDDEIEGRIREYYIIVDARNRIIMHDCADWERVASTKKLCKHVAKMLLTIGKPKATRILMDLYDHEQAWQLKPYTR